MVRNWNKSWRSSWYGKVRSCRFSNCCKSEASNTWAKGLLFSFFYASKFWLVINMYLNVDVILFDLLSTFLIMNCDIWQCCEALVRAVCSTDESPGCIIPRILYVDRYFSCGDKAKWDSPSGVKIHVMGSLILQTVFRYRSVCFFSLPDIAVYLILEGQTKHSH